MPEFRGSEAAIFYEQFGDGPDLVFVAGGGSTGSEWQRYQTPYFSQRFHATTFDNRGSAEPHVRCRCPGRSKTSRAIPPG